MVESRAMTLSIHSGTPFPCLGCFFDCLAPFAANKQVWGPRTMPVATWSMQGKVAWMRAREGVTGERGCAARKGRKVTLLSIFQTLEPPSHEQSNETRAINPVGKTAGVQRVWESPASHRTQGPSQYFQQSCNCNVWGWDIILGSSGRTVSE